MSYIVDRFIEKEGFNPAKREAFMSYLSKEAPTEKISEYLGYFGSYERTEAMVHVMLRASPSRCV
jgi:hypothetical protein